MDATRKSYRFRSLVGNSSKTMIVERIGAPEDISPSKTVTTSGVVKFEDVFTAVALMNIILEEDGVELVFEGIYVNNELDQHAPEPLKTPLAPLNTMFAEREFRFVVKRKEL